jgi:hypothetical protein
MQKYFYNVRFCGPKNYEEKKLKTFIEEDMIDNSNIVC